MKIKLLVLLFAILSPTALAVDQAQVAGAVGTAVMERSLDIIEASEIFGNDNGLSRRIAYVESADGSNKTVTGNGGIWQITSTNLAKLTDATYDLSSLYPAIQSKLNIDWANVAYVDLDKPLYSALACRLILAHAENNENVVISSDISQQFQLWSNYFYDNAPPKDSAEFTTLVNEIPTTCTTNLRDIFFVVDSSSTISTTDFATVKSFLKNVTSYYTIGPSDARIGIIQYSSNQETVLSLSDGTNSTTVQDTIDGLTLLGNAPVFTGAAIIHSYTTLLLTGRGSSNGVAQILMIVTHSASEDSYMIQQTLAVAAQIDIVAVGYGTSIEQTELNALATGNDNTHALLAQDAASLTTVTQTAQDSICSEQATVKTDSYIQGILQLGVSQFFDTGVSVTTTFQFYTTSGTAICYISTQVQQPSSAAYDLIAYANAPNVIVSTPVTPDTTGTFANQVFFSIEGSSNDPASFVVIIGAPAPTTTTTTTTTTAATVATAPTDNNNGNGNGNQGTTTTTAASGDTTTTNAAVPVAGDGSLEGGEIAGIVFACLIFLCGIVIAVAYYCFTRRDKSVTIKVGSRKKSVDVIVQPMNGIDQLVQRPASQESIARKQLRVALTKRDVDAVKTALYKFRTLRLQDRDGDVIRGERLITMHQCQDGLSYSVEKRSIRYLERAIYETKRMNFATELAPELLQAEVLLSDLKKVENLMNRLKNAMDCGDMESVEQICAELRALKGCSQATIDRMLDVHRCKDDLDRSILERDVELVTSALDAVYEKGYEPDLQVEVKRGKKMKKELEYLERARNDVLNLRASEVSEIRSYSNPPAGVHEVMIAVYLMVGYNMADVESWSDVQALMGRTGKESLRRQIMDINPRNLEMERAEAAKHVIDPYDFNAVQTLSIGLSMFYAFTLSMIEEVERLNSDSDESPIPFSDLMSRTPTMKPTWEQSRASMLIRR